MSNIFKPNVRRALGQNPSGSSQGIFGGDSNLFKNLEESKKNATLLKSVMLQTKNPGKAGKKSGMKEAKKAEAGVQGQRQKPKKKPNDKGANKNSNDSKSKDFKEKGNKPDDLCKLITPQFITFSHPSSHGLCGCGPVWTILFPQFPGMLIGQSAFLYIEQ